MTRFMAALDILATTPLWKSMKTWPGLKAIDNAMTIRKYYGNVSETAELEIVKLVERVRDHECTDARDRIFALYGLATNTNPSPHDTAPGAISMEVKYNVSVQYVHTIFALACLNSRAKSELLLANVPRMKVLGEVKWPSWVPTSGCTRAYR